MPYSLFTTFDYLGFWLYAVFGVMAAGPLLKGSTSSKLCGVTLGVYGIAYNGLLIAVLAGAFEAAQIEGYVLSVAFLLIVTLAAAVFNFRGMSGKGAQETV